MNTTEWNVRAGTKVWIRELCDDIYRNGSLDSDGYKSLVYLHPSLDDPAASTIWRFIEAWRKWPFCGMPLTREETLLLKETLT